ncbi:hypothetical protein [Streptomyces erythrochromogenes]|uniref:hypothetical protein n=1 Tax=Streptomyces erythrochromogenes TaxID=285574 RepID=UPI00341E8C9A
MMTCSTCDASAVVQWQRLLPDSTDTEPVGGCFDHALAPDFAGYVHQAACTGPGKNGTCLCPPPSKVEFPFEDPAAELTRRLPPGW